jgi:ABC-type uncharacterized transport system involved in gliding motility auxiliary subunit
MYEETSWHQSQQTILPKQKTDTTYNSKFLVFNILDARSNKDVNINIKTLESNVRPLDNCKIHFPKFK